jgi:hypothetical protein
MCGLNLVCHRRHAEETWLEVMSDIDKDALFAWFIGWAKSRPIASQ